MKLSDSKIKKFLIFPEMKSCTFQPKLEKIKVSHPEKISYTSGNRNQEETSYIFSNQSLLYFGKRKPRKNSLCFRKRNFLIPYISGSNFPSLKSKKLLIF